MSMRKKHLVVANWKMNPPSTEEAKEIFNKARRSAKKLKQTDVVIAPSFIHLQALSKLLPSKNIFLGAQNVHEKDSGPFTGEVGALSLKEFKVKFVILGHSERRAMGESNASIKEKIQNSLRNGITPIVCVGEQSRDNEGNYFQVVKDQLTAAFSGLKKAQLMDCTIAYEPIWTIGHTFKDSLSGTDMHEMSLFIKKTFAELFGKDYGWNAKILYGGSVEDENARDIMQKGDISGFLVGHSSLDPREFLNILEIVDEEKK